jgi:hypothetical protein
MKKGVNYIHLRLSLYIIKQIDVKFGDEFLLDKLNK